jgi:adenylate kinase
MKNIAFIGGIHGVGKSTVCRQICDRLDLTHLSASELLKWGDINEDAENKQVKDIQDTQDRLIVGLRNTIQTGKRYLLDGHYCLLNINGEIKNIPVDTFQMINPFSLNIILDDVSEIKKRLEVRDNKHYDYDLLMRMQDNELQYAKYLSEKLNVPLNVGLQKNFAELLNSLYNTTIAL